VSKRDDESQADMEVGMTTAERRRRRRRGAGLRVPSDNVPRRSSTPPVAPVPEDPGLAMSIAFSFNPDASEPMTSRTPTHESVPSFENHEGSPTVIDPLNEPGEQTDFEMKTREMPAVDLEELGLDAGAFGTLPLQRLSATELDPRDPVSPLQADDVRFVRRAPTDPGDEVEVDLDASVDGIDGDGIVDPGATLDRDAGRSGLSREPEIDLDGGEPTTIHHGPPSPPVDAMWTEDPPEPPRRPAAPAGPIETSQPRIPLGDAAPRTVSGEASPRTTTIPPSPSGPLGAPSLPSVVVSPLAAGDAYPRPVATESSQPRPIAGEPPRPPSGSIPIPSVVASSVAPAPPSAAPASPMPAAPSGGLRIARAQTVALSEDDLEEVREAARLSNQPAVPLLASPSPSQPSLPAIQPPRPMSTSIPPPMPPARMTRPRVAVVSPPESSPEIDLHAIEDRATEAATEFEVDVDGIVETKPADAAPGDAWPLEPRPVEPSATVLPVPPLPVPPPAEPRTRSIGPSPSPYAALGMPGAAPPGRDPQPFGALRDVQHGPAAPPPSAPPPPTGPPPPPLVAGPGRDSQPIGALREAQYATPPPPPAPHKAPPAPPAPARKPSPAMVSPLPKAELRDRDTKDAKLDGKPPRGKPWFIDLFDEDYLRTLPFLTPQATQAEAEFVIDAMGLTTGAQVLDVGCGYGRHAMELAARGFHIVGLDLSTPLLVRGGEEAHRRGLTINFVRGDMRELDFDAQFDGAYCLFSTFGYFDDETNKKTVSNIARALKPGGRMLIEILNRDYVIADLPTRVWWEGDGCVVLEEVELNYFSSRIQVNRSVVFDDGRQLEQEISVRAYSLHEVGKLMHSAGLRVLEVSGAYHTRGRFFGNQSRHIIVLAERKDPSAS
jgi:SAM-dependent methyltransferase